jgi:hypothetical protein
MEKCWYILLFCCGDLVYLMDIWYILWYFDTFLPLLYILPKKSGNPDVATVSRIGKLRPSFAIPGNLFREKQLKWIWINK